MPWITSKKKLKNGMFKRVQGEENGKWGDGVTEKYGKYTITGTELYILNHYVTYILIGVNRRKFKRWGRGISPN